MKSFWYFDSDRSDLMSKALMRECKEDKKDFKEDLKKGRQYPT